MGNTISVDGQETLETALRDGDALQPGSGRSTAHLLAWRYGRQTSGTVVEETAVSLADHPPNIDPRGAFVILHVFKETVSSWPFSAVEASAALLLQAL